MSSATAGLPARTRESKSERSIRAGYARISAAVVLVTQAFNTTRSISLSISLRVRISAVRRRSSDEGRSERRECANTGHSRIVCRKDQIDPSGDAAHRLGLPSLFGFANMTRLGWTEGGCAMRHGSAALAAILNLTALVAASSVVQLVGVARAQVLKPIQEPITGSEELGDLSQPQQALVQFYKAFN